MFWLVGWLFGGAWPFEFGAHVGREIEQKIFPFTSAYVGSDAWPVLAQMELLIVYGSFLLTTCLGFGVEGLAGFWVGKRIALHVARRTRKQI